MVSFRKKPKPLEGALSSRNNPNPASMNQESLDSTNTYSIGDTMPTYRSSAYANPTKRSARENRLLGLPDNGLQPINDDYLSRPTGSGQTTSQNAQPSIQGLAMGQTYGDVPHAGLQGATDGRPKSDHSSGTAPFPRYSTESGGHLGPRIPGIPHGDEEVEDSPSPTVGNKNAQPSIQGLALGQAYGDVPSAELQGATDGRPKSDHSSGTALFPRYSTESGGHLGPRIPGIPHGDEEANDTPSPTVGCGLFSGRKCRRPVHLPQKSSKRCNFKRINFKRRSFKRILKSTISKGKILKRRIFKTKTPKIKGTINRAPMRRWMIHARAPSPRTIQFENALAELDMRDDSPELPSAIARMLHDQATLSPPTPEVVVKKQCRQDKVLEKVKGVFNGKKDEKETHQGPSNIDGASDTRPPAKDGIGRSINNVDIGDTRMPDEDSATAGRRYAPYEPRSARNRGYSFAAGGSAQANAKSAHDRLNEVVQGTGSTHQAGLGSGLGRRHSVAAGPSAQGYMGSSQHEVCSGEGSVLPAQSRLSSERVASTAEGQPMSVQDSLSSDEGGTSPVQGDISDAQVHLGSVQGRPSSVEDSVSSDEGQLHPDPDGVSSGQGQLRPTQGLFSSFERNSASNEGQPQPVQDRVAGASPVQGDVSDAQAGVGSVQSEVESTGSNELSDHPMRRRGRSNAFSVDSRTNEISGSTARLNSETLGEIRAFAQAQSSAMSSSAFEEASDVDGSGNDPVLRSGNEFFSSDPIAESTPRRFASRVVLTRNGEVMTTTTIRRMQGYSTGLNNTYAGPGGLVTKARVPSGSGIHLPNSRALSYSGSASGRSDQMKVDANKRSFSANENVGSGSGANRSADVDNQRSVYTNVEEKVEGGGRSAVSPDPVSVGGSSVRGRQMLRAGSARLPPMQGDLPGPRQHQRSVTAPLSAARQQQTFGEEAVRARERATDAYFRMPSAHVQPSANVQAPGNEVHAPGNRVQAPSNEVQAPGNDVQAPDNSARARCSVIPEVEEEDPMNSSIDPLQSDDPKYHL